MVSRLSGFVPAALAGVVLLLLRSGAPVERVQAQGAAPTQAELDAGFLNAWKQQPRVTINVPAARAKLVVVKFNDWMCPGCRAAAAAFKPLLAKYEAMPGALQYVEKDWPWNTKCNANTSQTFVGHEASCDAAAAVRLAADQGKREEMTTWLFANQPNASNAASLRVMPDRVRAKAAEMLAVKDFEAAYALKLPDIKKDVAEGLALKIRSTPTYFINGVRAVGADEVTIPVHYFELALKYEFEKK
jgi:protein-disulfide isomerase